LAVVENASVLGGRRWTCSDRLRKQRMTLLGGGGGGGQICATSGARPSAWPHWSSLPLNLVKRGLDFPPNFPTRLAFEEAFDVVGDLDIMLPGKGVSKPATRTGKLGQSCANNLFCCGSRWRNVIEVLLR
jgi:hypothetical protein